MTLFRWFPVMAALLCLAAVLSVPAGQAAPVVELTDSRITLTDQYEYTVLDPPRQDAALYPLLSQADWLEYTAGAQSRSTYENGMWLRFTLRNDRPAPARRVFKLHWSTFEDVGLYRYSPGEGALFRVAEVDDWSLMQPAVDPLPYAFSLTVPAETSQQYYLYLKSNDKLFPPATLFSPAEFEDWRHGRTLVFGILFGVLFAMLGYNFCLFIFLRERSYWRYCVYVIASILYVLMMSGAGFAYVWGEVNWINRNVYGVLPALAFWAAGSFVEGYLLLRERGDWITVATRVILYTWVAIMVGQVLLDAYWLNGLTDGLAYLSCVYFIFVSSYLWYRGNVLAKYLAIAWFPLILTTFYLLLGLSGTLVFSPLMLNLQTAGFTLEVFLLSMALAARINYDRQQRIAAQNTAMQSTIEAREARERELAAQTRLLAQEQEAKERLHEEVASRTRELQHALSSLEQVNRQLKAVSETDGLTGLRNRGNFDATLAAELNAARRKQDHLALLLIDIDHFKQINDSYGHQAGDQCLKLIAQCLQSQLKRSRDYCARYGGEEFCILLPDTPPDQAAIVAERLRAAVAALEVPVDGETLSLTISLGFTSVRTGSTTTSDALLMCADKALYRAKREGRNRACFGEP